MRRTNPPGESGGDTTRFPGPRALGAVSDDDLVAMGDHVYGRSADDVVETAIATGTPTVTVAMRTPYDLGVHPASTTHIRTSSLLGPSPAAFGDVVIGGGEAVRRLPVAMPHLYARGHGSQFS